MPFSFYDALVGGLWGTNVLTALLTLSLALGLSHLDFGRLIGGIFLLPSRRTALVGLGIHYLIGLAFGLLYAGIFAYVGLPAVVWVSTVVGLGFGIYHWLLSMPLISIGRVLNRHVARGEEPDPGIWGIHYGPQEAALRLVGHLGYGAAFGFSYVATALLNGSATGTGSGNGLALLFAIVPAIAIVTLYANRIPAPAALQEPVFASTEPSERDARSEARHALRMRYERGEISWDEYQHLRRQYAAEP